MQYLAGNFYTKLIIISFPYRCGYKTKENGAFNNHSLSIHEKNRPWKCDDCNQNFSLKSTLDYHMKRIHETKDRPYKCDVCDKYFSSSSEMERHTKKEHGKNKKVDTRTVQAMLAVKKPAKFFCQICEKDVLISANFKDLTDKEAHINEFHRDKDGNYKCSKCVKRFATYQTLGWFELVEFYITFH